MKISNSFKKVEYLSHILIAFIQWLIAKFKLRIYYPETNVSGNSSKSYNLSRKLSLSEIIALCEMLDFTHSFFFLFVGESESEMLKLVPSETSFSGWNGTKIKFLSVENEVISIEI